MPTFRITVPETDSDAPQRLDKFLATQPSLPTRSQLKQLKAHIILNGKAANPSRLVKEGDIIELSYKPPAPSAIIPENIPLPILYEDDRIIVVDKPQGLVVHPGAGISHGTLVNALMYHCSEIDTQYRMRSPDHPHFERPGIVHRLDRDTSGIIIAAKHADVQHWLMSQFMERTVKKQYLAITANQPPSANGEIDRAISRRRRDPTRFTASARRPRTSKASQTRYRLIRTFPIDSRRYSFLTLYPTTGRTHQIRVHLRWLKCPIIGDPLYYHPDPNFLDSTMMLHAYRLTIRLTPDSPPTTFTAPIPPRFRQILGTLRTASRDSL